MAEWLIDAWNRVTELPTESAWDRSQEVDMDIGDGQETIRRAALTDGAFLADAAHLDLQDL
jgi:hypothetical protein